MDDLVLAVDEAATNIVMHGYKAGPGPAAVIEVEVVYRDPGLSVYLRDQAPPFDPTATPVVDELPPLTERGPGGLGIFLIRKTMDEFRYRRTPDGWNELCSQFTGHPHHRRTDDGTLCHPGPQQTHGHRYVAAGRPGCIELSAGDRACRRALQGGAHAA